MSHAVNHSGTATESRDSSGCVGTREKEDMPVEQHKNPRDESVVSSKDVFPGHVFISTPLTDTATHGVNTEMKYIICENKMNDDKRPLSVVEQTVQDIVIEVENLMDERKVEGKQAMDEMHDCKRPLSVMDIEIESLVAERETKCKQDLNVTDEPGFLLAHKSIGESAINNNNNGMDNSILSEVVQNIIQDILQQVDQKANPNIEGNESKTPQQQDINGFHHKCGDKRTLSEASIDEGEMEVTTDSLYVMNLVQKELEAVGENLEETDGSKLKLVDYESSSSSDESSSESSSDSESRIIVQSRLEHDGDNNEHDELPKTMDEVLLKDLPTEPKVSFMVPEDVNLVHIGVITSIVELMVVVRALPQTPALDADTFLFLENRNCIGKVFETFGPVQSPFYSVRFNSPEDIASEGIEVNMTVFFAPAALDYTKLIFTSQLEKMKGSDASWKHDQEPPTQFVEYSDDEQEAQVKLAKKKQKRKGNKSSLPGQAENTDSLNTNDSAASRRPQKAFSRNWQGRGRGNPHYGSNPRQPSPGMLPPRPLHQYHGVHNTHQPPPPMYGHPPYPHHPDFPPPPFQMPPYSGPPPLLPGHGPPLLPYNEGGPPVTQYGYRPPHPGYM